MKNLFKIVSILLFIVLCPLGATAQRSVEAYAMVGYTIVDVEKFNEAPAEDWNQLAGGFYVQGFFLEKNDFQLGGEIGYAHYFWYSYQGTYLYDWSIGATKILVIGRHSLSENAFMEAGLGVNIFEEATEFAIEVAVGYKIPVGDQWSIPIKLRTDFVLGNTSMVPITLNVGAAYSF